MSADADFQMDRGALIAAASTVTACATFRIVEGGSRHFCDDCGQTQAAHIIVALRDTPPVPR